MKVVLSGRGSRGDVCPIIDVAIELHRRGHEVTLCVPELFDDVARRGGLTPILYNEDSDLVMKNMGAGYDAMRRALQWFSRNIKEQFNVMARATAGSEALVTTVNEVAAPSVARYRGIRHFRLAYYPVIPGSQPPPLLPLQRLPAIANRAVWRVLNLTLGAALGGCLNKERRALGLGPIGEFSQYCAGGSHTILAVNSVLAPPRPEWRFSHSYAGYCYGRSDEELEPGLKKFLEGGPPPLYVGFGSVNIKQPEKFTRKILDAAIMAGCRLVLGSGWAGLGKNQVPGTVFIAGETPHQKLFPFLAGVAHHGGCGTTHTALRAAIPQFVMPQIADQFYWGHRVHALGMGPAPVPPDRLSVGRLSRALMEMVSNPSFTARARVLSTIVRDDDGVAAAAGIIETKVQQERAARRQAV